MEDSKTMEQVVEEQFQSLEKKVVQEEEQVQSQMTNSMYVSEASIDDKDNEEGETSEDEQSDEEEHSDDNEGDEGDDEKGETGDEYDNEEQDEEEEQEEGDNEKHHNHTPSALIRHHYEFPFPITCTFSILMLIYAYQLFRMLCEMFGGSCNGNCICFPKKP